MVTLSETLYDELVMLGAPLRVSVLCPGFVATRIADSARNRPATLSDTAPRLAGAEMLDAVGRQLIAGGSPPAAIAEYVFRAIEEERFYVLPHPQWKEHIRTRMEGILAERNPSPPDVTELMRRLRGEA